MSESRPISKTEDKPLGPAWMLVPAAAGGLALTLDAAVLNPLTGNPGLRDDPLRIGLQGGRWALNLVGTTTYTLFEPKLSAKWAAVSDATYGAFGAASLVAGLLAKKGDPFLHAGVKVASDIVAARFYRHLGEVGGSLFQIGMGAVLILTGALANCGGPEVDEASMYVDPSMVSGNYNVPGNPYEKGTRFPNLCLNLIETGSDYVAVGLIRGGIRLFKGKPEKMGGLSISPKIGPKEFVLTFGGTL